MKVKKLAATAVLAIFVAGSVVYAIYKEHRAAPPPPPAPSKAPVCSSNDCKPATVPVTERVVVYYFHRTARCPTCRMIEAYTREALSVAFAAEIERGNLEIQSINLDEPQNEHFVQDYQISSSTVVAAAFSNSNRGPWRRLDRVWQLVRTQPAFFDYIQREVKELLPKS